jgi:hypothetical protein
MSFDPSCHVFISGFGCGDIQNMPTHLTGQPLGITTFTAPRPTQDENQLRQSVFCLQTRLPSWKL